MICARENMNCQPSMSFTLAAASAVQAPKIESDVSHKDAHEDMTHAGTIRKSFTAEGLPDMSAMRQLNSTRHLHPATRHPHQPCCQRCTVSAGKGKLPGREPYMTKRNTIRSTTDTTGV